MNNVKMIELLEELYENLNYKIYQDSDRYWQTFIFPRKETHLTPDEFYRKNGGEFDQKLLDRIDEAIVDLRNED